MKLLTAKQIAKWDAHTIKHKPITSLNLMEHAATLCFNQIVFLVDKQHLCDNFYVFCGTGNNGGDGLVIARLLALNNFKVKVFILDSERKSADFLANYELLKKLPIQIVLVNNSFVFVEPTEKFTAIDALFGTGLNKPVNGLGLTLIEYINNYALNTIAVDMPSGLPAEVYSLAEIENVGIVKADFTITFQQPKQSFLFADTFKFVGNFYVLDIGLLPSFEESETTDRFYITFKTAKALIKRKQKFSHKGTNGHALVIGGSFGKIGAVVIGAKAALLSGCGLVTAFVPKVGYTILQTALPEAMVLTDDELYLIRNFPSSNNYNALGVGVGMGTEDFTKIGFKQWLNTINKPIVIDADAINICAELLKDDLNFKFPENAILTPHPKEFDRLVGLCNNAFERYKKQLEFSKKHQVIVVLKGAHTCITTPDGLSYFNSSGNFLLATAGSGDALTGIITSFLAQGYTTKDASIMGVFIHGYCASLALENKNGSLIATNLINYLPKALYNLYV